MKKLLSFLLSIVLIFSFSSCSEASKPAVKTVSTQLTQKEKIEDFEYMYNILKDNYPYFEVNKRLNNIDWLSRKKLYTDEIKATTDDENFYNTLESILGELKNGHVHMLDSSSYKAYKKVYSKMPDKCGAWINELNKKKVQKRYKADNNNTETSEIGSVTKNNVTAKIILKNKIAYMSVHLFNYLNIKSDSKIIRPFLTGIKNYKVLIIDIRDNPGGSTYYWIDNIVSPLISKTMSENLYDVYRGGKFTEPFIESMTGYSYKNLGPIKNITWENLKNAPPEIKKDFKYYYKYTNYISPKNPVGFKGKIYLLVNAGVFSSSEAFAVFAKDTGFATLVGETTSGDGIGSDPAVCALPHSGFVFTFTKGMGLTSDGTCNFEHKTEPDIKVNAKVTGDVNTDEAIQAVIKRER